MKYARIVDGKVIETIDFDPTGKYHDAIRWTRVPENIKCGWETIDGKTYTEPHPNKIEPLPPPQDYRVMPKIIHTIEFKQCFTFAERQAIYKLKNEGDAVLIDWISILDDPRCLTVELSRQWIRIVLEYLIGKIPDFDAKRIQDILSGIVL